MPHSKPRRTRPGVYVYRHHKIMRHEEYYSSPRGGRVVAWHVFGPRGRLSSHTTLRQACIAIDEHIADGGQVTMDPNENLKAQRRLATAISARAAADGDDQEELATMAAELASYVESLDAWLANGGFLPDNWRR